jgi:tRNA(fMet)-specific endonuclease VapC
MPRYMLDTNMCIYLMKNQAVQVARRFAECYIGDYVKDFAKYPGVKTENWLNAT